MSAAHHQRGTSSRPIPSIGARMKMVRTSVRLRQKDMAVVLGVSRQSLIQYECDICAPPYRVLRNACEEFAIDGSWLLLGGPSSTMLRYGKKGAV